MTDKGFKGDFIKKLLYQSNHRGCKETDLILGGFATKNIDLMTDKELLQFEQILKCEDGDIYDWYTKKKNLPEDMKSNIMSRILHFIP